MALTTHTYAQELARVLAEAARRAPLVAELWVSTRPGGVDLWLVTQPVDMSTEHDLHGLADALYAQFTGADFQVYIVNPRHFRDDVHRALPQGSVQVSLAVS